MRDWDPRRGSLHRFLCVRVKTNNVPAQVAKDIGFHHHLRRVRRVRIEITNDVEAFVPHPADHGRDHADRVIDQMLAEMLGAYDDEQIRLWMHGRDDVAIAQICGRTPGAVKKRRERLFKKWRNEFDAPEDITFRARRSSTIPINREETS
jgi:hypothetical protein